MFTVPTSIAVLRAPNRKGSVGSAVMINIISGGFAGKLYPVNPSSETILWFEMLSKQGEFLVRNVWMSVDPYMRNRMTERKSDVPPFELGKALEGGSVGKVVELKNRQLAVGDYVLGMKGWREYWISDGNPASGISKIDPNRGPIQLFLGIFGMTGLTAYVGLLRIGQLKEGETVFVSAASGAVGSVVCQITKLKGCYVIGSAGSKEKVNWLINNAGVDYAFNYKKLGDENISTELRKAYLQSSSEEEGIDE